MDELLDVYPGLGEADLPCISHALENSLRVAREGGHRVGRPAGARQGVQDREDLQAGSRSHLVGLLFAPAEEDHLERARASGSGLKAGPATEGRHGARSGWANCWASELHGLG